MPYQTLFCCLTILIVTLPTANTTAEESVIPPSKFSATGHTTDTVDQVRERVKAKRAVIVDVREQHEWDAGHLKAARLVPLSAVRANQLTEAMKKSLPKNKPIYIHCRSGRRVLAASTILREQGYDIRPLRDGYASLLKKGFRKATKTQKAQEPQ